MGQHYIPRTAHLITWLKQLWPSGKTHSFHFPAPNKVETGTVQMGHSWRWHLSKGMLIWGPINPLSMQYYKLSAHYFITLSQALLLGKMGTMFVTLEYLGCISLDGFWMFQCQNSLGSVQSLCTWECPHNVVTLRWENKFCLFPLFNDNTESRNLPPSFHLEQYSTGMAHSPLK